MNVLSRHQLSPTEHEWKMITRLFRYLEHSKDWSLTYKGKLDSLEAFSDASFADCKNSLTTSGHAILLYGDIVSWKTHKQSYVALSTCQAEYVALSEACRESIALSISLRDIPNAVSYPITLWCDNKAAVACTQMDGSNKLRHMTEVHEDYVKQCAENKLVEIKWICSKEQRADVFTKPLPHETHFKLCKSLFNF